MEKKEKEEISRRDFMKTTILSVGVLIGTSLGLPAIAYVVGPALQQYTDEWIRLGLK